MLITHRNLRFLLVCGLLPRIQLSSSICFDVQAFVYRTLPFHFLELYRIEEKYMSICNSVIRCQKQDCCVSVTSLCL